MVFSNISYTWPIFLWSFWKVNKILKNDASVASSAYKGYLRTMSAKTLAPGRRSISSQQLLWVVLKVWMLSVFDKVKEHKHKFENNFLESGLLTLASYLSHDLNALYVYIL